MKSDVYETSVSGHHKTIFSVFRKAYAKVMRGLSSIVALKKYGQNSSNEAFQNKISQLDLSFELTFEIFQSTLDPFAPYKQKRLDIRGEQISF